MYRRLKNILGISLVVLAVLLSQIPVPKVQAEIARGSAETQAEGTSVVTFNMNGGRFEGSYNGYNFKDKTPVLVIDNGKVISIFPDDKFATYSGYMTDANTWYIDKECLTRYDTEYSVTDNITLYKKWYNITSDGTTLAAEGFHISADGTVLYRYDGEDAFVEIPRTVTVIAEGAFDQLAQDVRGVILPPGIHTIEKDAFRGAQDDSIVYIYDSGTAASITYGKQLDAEYEQLVYSEYPDPEKTEEIAGIQYISDEQNPNITSASAPKSTQHIKDSTPKTGDPLQYRMLVVCAIFSAGVLMILTGNGKKRRFSAF